MLSIYGSSREEGNSEVLAQYLLTDIVHQSIYLRNYSIHPIRDQRHDQGGFDPVDDDFDQLINQFLNHDVIVFVTPLYWYGMTGLMKNFVDRWSQAMRDERLDFKERVKGKEAYLIITGGGEVEVKALPLIQQFQLIFDFVGMSFKGYVIGKGVKRGDVHEDEGAILKARLINEKLKRHT
ncbi:flavodoxin family protein [Bacillus carboniphilus]|uniref:Flavodoxin family protein n=1 Tax=Bacillus carboniphilus TaxID=86663 RepID=A0ABY9K0K6_9BACI|nr:flavodoxin family protein [Bacillus carboniphilus]WLR44248.1 flavodoxin family protein [Bacillus carboniphilus]